MFYDQALDRRHDEELITTNYSLINRGLASWIQPPKHRALMHPNRQAVTTGSQAVRLAGVHRGPRRHHTRLTRSNHLPVADFTPGWSLARLSGLAARTCAEAIPAAAHTKPHGQRTPCASPWQVRVCSS